MIFCFRADASVKIGTGHIMRCLTLADALAAQGAECQFICRAHAGNLMEFIRSKGYITHALRIDSEPEAEPTALSLNASDLEPAHSIWLGATQAQDAEACAPILSAYRPDWLIVDHYALDTSWERALASYYRKLLVIDDLADRQHECEVLLDQNLGRTASHDDGLVPKDCLRLIGPEYALLRPEFAEMRDRSLRRREHPELKRILIFIGGVDQTNVTGKVLEVLADAALPQNIQLDIIMGASAPYLKEVQQQAALLPCKATVNVNVSDMAERMCLADLSIGAAGSTSWERCCLGLPTIMLVLADNQVKVAQALVLSGAAKLINLGQNVTTLLMELLLPLIDDPERLLNMSECAARIVDGSGVNAVMRELEG